jgi:putative transposase
VPTGLKRYYGSQDLHFITCSCHERRAWLATPARRNLFLDVLEQTRQAYDFVVVGYVVMPEHFHLLIGEPERGTPSLVMQVLKQRFARKVLQQIRRDTVCLGSFPTASAPEHVWQTRFYDFNVWTARKHLEKLRYLHRNPVKRGLVLEPDQWQWSSFRSYAYEESGRVVINAPGSAKLKIRSRA